MCFPVLLKCVSPHRSLIVPLSKTPDRKHDSHLLTSWNRHIWGCKFQTPTLALNQSICYRLILVIPTHLFYRELLIWNLLYLVWEAEQYNGAVNLGGLFPNHCRFFIHFKTNKAFLDWGKVSKLDSQVSILSSTAKWIQCDLHMAKVVIMSAGCSHFTPHFQKISKNCIKWFILLHSLVSCVHSQQG